MSAREPITNASDAALAGAVMRAGANGSPVEEAELCRRFGRRVRLFGRSRLRDDSAVDDLVQRVMILLLSKLRRGEVHSPDNIASFVLGTARLVSREMSRPLQQPVALEAELPCPLAETHPDPLALQRMGDCLKTLAERERAVVALTFFQDQTAVEIGEALGMQSGHVRITRHRALGRLRGCMGLGVEEVAA